VRKKYGKKRDCSINTGNINTTAQYKLKKIELYFR
jgi:hypothetical protein